MDHFAQIGGIGKPEEPTLEGYSTLSYLARMTQSAKLGTLVTGVIYRYPGNLVKTVTAQALSRSPSRRGAGTPPSPSPSGGSPRGHF
jgi:hypothetical protein